MPDPTLFRLPALDAVRGIAILMVIASHYVPARLTSQPLVNHVIGLGRGGVILFFLLSGYLIFRNVERQSLPVFMTRRLFKILPSYWLNLAVILAMGALLTGQPHHAARSYFSDLLMITDLDGENSVSGVYWTLLIEVKFYLFIALQYLLLRNRRMPAIMLAMIALNLADYLLRGHGNLLLTFFPVFYIGIYIRRIEEAGWSRRAMLGLGAVTTAIAASMIAVPIGFVWWSMFYVIAGSVLLVAFLRMGWQSRVLSFFGRTSYSNYLYHAMIGAALLPLLDRAAPGIGKIGGLLVAVGAATAAATLLYYGIEEQMVHLGKRLEAAVRGEVRPPGKNLAEDATPA